MKIELLKEENYAAKFVVLEEFEKIPKADRLVHAIINSNRVIVAADTLAGTKGVFFPIECQINKEFLSKNSLFSDKFSNVDQTKVGFFGKHGRVRAVKLRDAVSEGFFVPLSFFKNWIGVDMAEWDSVPLNTSFDTINGISVSCKYFVQQQRSDLPRIRDNKMGVKIKSRLIPGEYQLHYSTSKLVDQIHLLNPNDFIFIDIKLHGTSVSMGRVLVKKKLSFVEKIKKFFGFKVELTEYDNIYASRTVIKNKDINPREGFYKEDVWKKAFDQIEKFLQDGQQIYAEIVGYTTASGMIQKGYDYGCNVGEQELYIYRITSKENDEIREWGMQEVIDWCSERGIKTPPVFYKGLAKDLFPDLPLDQHWHRNLIERLRKSFNMEKDCEMCKNKVPAEGLCFKVQGRNLPAWKFKSFKFLQKETELLDAGEVDLESSQSIEENT